LPYQTLGKPVPRVEGVDKVTGTTLFVADLPVPGALCGKVLRSPLPHARVGKVDTSQAKKLAGVHAVISGADLPSLLIGQRMKDMPVLARERVRYVGEPVAAVAAESRDIAEEALNLIEVEYLDNITTMTVFITDNRFGDRFVEIRKEYFDQGYPCSALITVHSLARPEMLVEIQAIAVLDE